MLDKIIQAGLGDVFEACSVQVLHRGDEWLSGAWGVIDPDACAQPVTRETLFDLASVTKLFTVSAFLSLVGEGRVALDDPLVSVLPEFDGEPRAITGGKNPHTLEPNEPPGELAGQTVTPGEVTFRHLLTHTSGLAPWVDVYNAAGKPPSAPTIPGDLPRVTRWARAQAVLARAPFVDAVGANVHYSDLGLMLLAWAVERLGDYPLEQAIDERVTGPLGLKRVTFNPLQHGYEREDTVATEYDTRWRERRVWGEVHDENACGLGGVAGHAGLFGAAGDVARFGEAWRTHDDRLGIPGDVMAAAVTAQAEDRGLGWMTRSENSSSGALFSAASYGHTGFTGTSLWIDPQRELVVALLTNRVYMGREKPGIHDVRRAVHDAIAEAIGE